DSGAGGAEWVTECDRSAIWIDAIHREPADIEIDPSFPLPIRRIRSRFQIGDQLRCEGFVDFPQVDLFGPEPMAREEAWNRTRRCHQHSIDAEIHRVDFPIDELDRGF